MSVYLVIATVIWLYVISVLKRLTRPLFSLSLEVSGYSLS